MPPKNISETKIYISSDGVNLSPITHIVTLEAETVVMPSTWEINNNRRRYKGLKPRRYVSLRKCIKRGWWND